MRSKIRELLERGYISLPESSSPAASSGSARQAASPSKPSRASLGRHKRKCSVCRHPERAFIDEDFLAWRSADQIAKDYGISDHSSVYRHAHATGLYDKRARTLRFALAPVIEQAQTVEATARSVVNAVYVLAHLDDEGKWISRRSNRQKPRLKSNAKH